MQSEIFGVEGFLEDIKEIEPKTFDSLDTLVITLQQKLKTRIKTKGLPPALVYLVERKIRKVAHYIHYTEDYCGYNTQHSP